jgi:hypothetical protein
LKDVTRQQSMEYQSRFYTWLDSKVLSKRVANKIRNGLGAKVVAVPAPNVLCCCLLREVEQLVLFEISILTC